MWNHIEKDIQHVVFFFVLFIPSLAQIWLCHLVYKHEMATNALKLMHDFPQSKGILCK